jgi:hypothetical protein
MPLFRLLRRLVPKSEQRTVVFGELGEATNTRDGGDRFWIVQNPLTLAGHSVSLVLDTGGVTPGDPELGAVREVTDRWADLWLSIVSKFQSELDEDGPDGEREQFLRAMRPTAVELSAKLDLWVVRLAPEIYSHDPFAVMKGFTCESFGMDG